jgi:hypothetical protein
LCFSNVGASPAGAVAAANANNPIVKCRSRRMGVPPFVRRNR